MTKKITVIPFAFFPGRVLARKYEVLSFIGKGWEGEVYKVRELATGIDRAAKFFYPERNINNRRLQYQVEKAHKLKNCRILIQYNTVETMTVRQQSVYYMVSDLVEGQSLATFLQKQKNQRLPAFEALHLLYALAKGMSSVHQLNEYHGDLHPGNIMLARYGLRHDVRVFDFFHWSGSTRDNIFDDVVAMVKLFYQTLGAQKTYAQQPPAIKSVVCGLKRSIMKKKFKTAGMLASFLERLNLLTTTGPSKRSP